MTAPRAGCAAIVDAMKTGGYFQRIMAAGPELDRVKDYLHTLEGTAAATSPGPLQYPDYPLFPGLRNQPFRDTGDLEGPLLLERNAGMIHDEWAALDDSAYIRYAPAAMRSLWMVHLLHYMGVGMPARPGECDGTRALLRRLPGVCLAYPWGDALLSVHASNSHLRAHCSVDNLRVRCHLALQVPPGCRIRVGEETRQWQEGRALLFEDSFEHEVWNRGEARRAILIVDFWHPDLTPVETQALTAGFCKSEVRNQFMLQRLQAVQHLPQGWIPYLGDEVKRQDRRPEIARYWS
jgi:hypothetical protein